MRQLIFLGLVFCLTCPAANARSKPTDMVRVIKAADEDLDWQMYDKKFADLKFDKRTLERIKKTENELARSEHNAASRYRLTNVRIVGNDVQSLIFRNDYGDTHLVELRLTGPDFSCGLTLSGNGFSSCSE